MSNVVKLNPVEVGAGYRFDPDDILEKNKGLGWEAVAIIGTIDGEIAMAYSVNAGEALILMEKAKLKIIGER